MTAARRTATLALLSACIACGSTTAAPSGPAAEPASVRVVDGDAQVGLTRIPLTDSLVIRVVDGSGTPVVGAAVRWEEAGGDGEVRPSSTTTDRNGMARTLWVLGEEVGPGTARAVVDSLEVVFRAEAKAAAPGDRYEGRSGYVSYSAGELPLIISAGHGGLLEPEEIPDRTEGTMVTDANTDALALAMADSLEARFGARPHLILSHLRRRKLDVNRELGEAAQGHPLAEHAWREYHGFIDHARDRVEREHGAGFYVDVHGHGHEILRLELGYLLTRSDLNRPDDQLDTSFATRSSIRALAASSPLPLSALVRGDLSLGTLYENAGVPAVPSAQQPAPGADPFFSGGYSTRRHGSRDGGTVSGVQIEAHRAGLRDTADNRARFAGISGRVLEEYLAAHYDLVAAAARN